MPIEYLLIAILVGPMAVGAVIWAVFMVLRKAKIIKPYQPPAQETDGKKSEPIRCKLCQAENPGGSLKCTSCGVELD